MLLGNSPTITARTTHSKTLRYPKGLLAVRRFGLAVPASSIAVVLLACKQFDTPCVKSFRRRSRGSTVPTSATEGVFLIMSDCTARVILVRHGETALNAGGQLRGRLDPDLDDTGAAEIAALARALLTYDVGTVHTSPLLRARRTAQAIADACGVSVEIDERLNDRDYGQWAGQRKQDVLSRWGSIDAAPGVEPATDVVARAMAAFEELADRPGAVLVAHDAINQALLQRLDPSLPGPPPQHTGGRHRLKLTAAPARRPRRWKPERRLPGEEPVPHSGVRESRRAQRSMNLSCVGVRGGT